MEALKRALEEELAALEAQLQKLQSLIRGDGQDGDADDDAHADSEMDALLAQLAKLKSEEKKKRTM